MPARSEPQRRFFAMCLHSPERARGKCPSKAVSREFAVKPAGGYAKGKAR